MDIRNLCERSRDEFEDWCRLRSASHPINPMRAMCRLFGQYPFYVDLADEHMGPHLILDGFWESWTAMAVVRFVKPNWRCIDVGANHGVFTVLLSKLATEGHVFAFEPNSRSFEFLQENTRINGCSNADASPLAIGDSVSEGVLRWKRGNPTSASLLPSPKDHPHRQDECSEPVGVSRLDALVRGDVHFIKIDAEGMDYEVIRGAQALMDANPKCSILFEHAGFLLGPEDVQKQLLAEAMDRCNVGVLHNIGYDGWWKPVEPREVAASDPNRVWNLLIKR